MGVGGWLWLLGASCWLMMVFSLGEVDVLEDLWWTWFEDRCGEGVLSQCTRSSFSSPSLNPEPSSLAENTSWKYPDIVEMEEWTTRSLVRFGTWFNCSKFVFLRMKFTWKYQNRVIVIVSYTPKGNATVKHVLMDGVKNHIFTLVTPKWPLTQWLLLEVCWAWLVIIMARFS